MKYLLLVIVMLIYLHANSQTCIIVHADTIKNIIYIGADTKVVRNNYISGQRIIQIDTFKKIGGYNNIYFVVAGSDVPSSFDIAMRACKTDTTIKDVAFKFRDIYGQIFKKNMAMLKTVYPQQYFSEYVNKEAGASAVFFGIENGKAKMIRVLLGIYEDDRRIPWVKWGANIVPEFKQEPTFVLGHSEGISKVMLLNSTYKGDILKTIEKLIKIQADTTPESVGLPIDIMKITTKQVIQKRITH